MGQIKRKTGAAWTFKRVVPLVLLGYLTGVILTLFWYWWHPWQRFVDLGLEWYSIVGGAFIAIFLFYTRSVRWVELTTCFWVIPINPHPLRCIVALAIPSLCSSRGRAFLISFAFVLVALGPTANIIANLKVLLRSLACAQELLRLALGQMLDVVLEPVRAIKLALELMLEEVRKVIGLITEILMRILEEMILIIDTLKNCAEWLKSVVNLCNAEMGTPWTRCKKAADKAMIRCRTKMGIFKPLCYATKLFLALCYPAKIIDVFCSGFWDFSWTQLDTILKRFDGFVDQIHLMFDANITFEHEFYFDTNSSKNLSDVGEEIIQDINRRLAPFTFITDIVDLLCWIMVIAVFIKSIIFYLRYMHSLSYQNIFITKLFKEVDRRQRNHDSASLLPLNRLERRTYMKITSLRLTTFELLSVVENAFFLLITCLQLLSICLVDYGLFWLLDRMSFYGHQEAGLEVPAYIDLEIKGGGFVGDTMRGVANAFRPLTQKHVLETNPCLPLPKQPDYRDYWRIGSLCLLAWLILLAEPYVLRLRHPIMAHFHPERALKRAEFLHEKIGMDRGEWLQDVHILFTSHNFFFQKASSRLSGACSFSRCCCCCRSKDECTICGRTLDSTTRHACDTPGCKGVYCDDCFKESRGQCCLCKRPLDYGDFSDCSDVE
ncbi:hypothetical protein KR018_001776 [Drosophila ironensis]|nr:hypothetical protein KR018_001776 [Drosophila ironensis]